MRRTNMRVLVTVAVLLVLSGCGENTIGPPPSRRPAPPAPKVQLDDYARRACNLLDHALARRNGGDPTGANQDESVAVTAARQPRSAGLKQLATGNDTLSLSGLRWCHAHARG
jgi:hypothetical protein